MAILLENEFIIEINQDQQNGIKINSGFVPIAKEAMEDFSESLFAPEGTIFMEKSLDKILLVMEEAPQVRKIFLTKRDFEEEFDAVDFENYNEDRIVSLFFPSTIIIFKIRVGDLALEEMKVFGRIGNKCFYLPLPNMDSEGVVCLGLEKEFKLKSLKELKDLVNNKFWNTWFTTELQSLLVMYKEKGRNIRGIKSWEYFSLSHKNPEKLLEDPNQWILCDTLEGLIAKSRKANPLHLIYTLHSLNAGYFRKMVGTYEERGFCTIGGKTIRVYDHIKSYGMLYKILIKRTPAKTTTFLVFFVFAEGRFNILSETEIGEILIENPSRYLRIEAGKYYILGTKSFGVEARSIGVVFIKRIFRLGKYYVAEAWSNYWRFFVILDEDLTAREVEK